MQKKRTGRMLCSLALSAVTLWGVSVTAPAKNARDALRSLKDETLGVMLLRYERGNGGEDFLSLRTSLALHATPLLREGEENIAQAWSAELEQKPDDSADETGDAQDSEGTVLTQEETPDEIAVTENGSPARTLKASDPSGYTVFGNVYINNGSDAALDASMLSGDYAAKLGAEGPQVLIIHTHGSESYTMPPGQEYDVSDTFRTLDTNCNMIRIGDEMAQVLGLPKPPRTIESYDISNWGDGTSVCGMVTFRDGKPYKAGYRKFRMKTVAGTDDYASLAETVSRRAAEYEKYSGMAANGEPSSNYFGQKPDLLLMDGGRGQVSAAKAALAGTALADVPLYGMVKDDHHRTRAIVDSEGREIAINMNRGTFTFITAIQDETHRFANAYRKQQMNKKSYSSTLTEVPGVGPKTAKALMAQFKSVGAVKEATPDQLENTPGVGRQMAQTIYEYFHPQG